MNAARAARYSRTERERGRCFIRLSVLAIGKMRYDPGELRWDGNEQVLRDFEMVNRVLGTSCADYALHRLVDGLHQFPHSQNSR